MFYSGPERVKGKGRLVKREHMFGYARCPSFLLRRETVAPTRDRSARRALRRSRRGTIEMLEFGKTCSTGHVYDSH